MFKNTQAVMLESGAVVQMPVEVVGVAEKPIVYEKVIKPPTEHPDVEGWFDFAAIYDLIAGEAKTFATSYPVVEVGSWMGKSTLYLAETFKRREIDNPIYAVDTWLGSDEEAQKETLEKLAQEKKTLFGVFMDNLIRYDCFHKVFPIRRQSQDAADMFEEESLLAVFIDGDHTYSSVQRDLKSWYPNVISGGIFAGHDIFWGEVHAAVSQFCQQEGLTFTINNKSWLVRKP